DEALDFIGDDRRLAGAYPLEQVPVWDEGDALPPRPVARREMRPDVEIGTEIGTHRAEQFALHRLRFGERAVGEHGPVMEDLPAHDLVNPRLVDAQRAQLVGQLDRVAPRP